MSYVRGEVINVRQCGLYTPRTNGYVSHLFTLISSDVRGRYMDSVNFSPLTGTDTVRLTSLTFKRRKQMATHKVDYINEESFISDSLDELRRVAQQTCDIMRNSRNLNLTYYID